MSNEIDFELIYAGVFILLFLISLGIGVMLMRGNAVPPTTMGLDQHDHTYGDIADLSGEQVYQYDHPIGPERPVPPTTMDNTTPGYYTIDQLVALYNTSIVTQAQVVPAMRNITMPVE